MSNSNRRVFKVDNVVHHKTIRHVKTENEYVYTDKYMIVINETHVFEGKTVGLGKFYLYTLFFDNLSKNSILTHYYSEHVTKEGVSNWTTSYYGECEIE